MRSHKLNQHTNRFGLKQSTMVSVWQMVALILLGVIVTMKLQPPVISPLSDNPFVETVRATEVTPKTDVAGAIKRIAGQHAPRLLKIAKAESNFKENAWNNNTNGTIDIGVFQINSIHFPNVPGQTREAKIRWLLNAENNIIFAMNLYLSQGIKPWSASKHVWNK